MTKYLYDRILEEARKLLDEAGLENADIEKPPEHIKAFLAVPCFRFAKDMKKAPQEIALEKSEKIAGKLGEQSYFSEVKAEGSYINFYLNWTKVASEIIKEIEEHRDAYGRRNLGGKKRIVVDMSSPNIAKPMSVAHLRSTIIGDSIARIYEFIGYEVIKDNHLGDWGTQFGKLLYAFKHWGDSKKVNREGTRALLEVYVKFHKEAEKNPELEEKGREEFSKLEKGKKKKKKLWEWFVSISKKEFEEIYDMLGVNFDYWLGESFYVEMCDDVIELALKRKIAEVGEQGEVVVKLDKYGLPNLLIRKSDESTLYATRDLATIRYRMEKFKPFRIIYVVGSEQRLYFRQVFKTAELLGFCKEEALKHVYFGLMKLPEGKLSTRKGRVVLLQDVFQKTVDKAFEIITQKNPKLKNKEEVAKKVAVAAMKFADLSQNRVKDFLFDWDKFVSFEGDTGPYLQYTYARAKSIIRKAEEMNIDISGADITAGQAPQNDAELEILEMLIRFPTVIMEAAKHHEPHRIAEYLIELAHKFNSFYQRLPVLKAEEKIRDLRLHMVECVSQVIKNGLMLLGIEVIEEM